MVFGLSPRQQNNNLVDLSKFIVKISKWKTGKKEKRQK